MLFYLFPLCGRRAYIAVIGKLWLTTVQVNALIDTNFCCQRFRLLIFTEAVPPNILEGKQVWWNILDQTSSNKLLRDGKMLLPDSCVQYSFPVGQQIFAF